MLVLGMLEPVREVKVSVGWKVEPSVVPLQLWRPFSFASLFAALSSTPWQLYRSLKPELVSCVCHCRLHQGQSGVF